jgi:hypothetical protein
MFTPPIISCRAEMVEKGDLKALFRLFWNNINQQMINDQAFRKSIIREKTIIFMPYNRFETL